MTSALRAQANRQQKMFSFILTLTPVSEHTLTTVSEEVREAVSVNTPLPPHISVFLFWLMMFHAIIM